MEGEGCRVEGGDRWGVRGEWVGGRGVGMEGWLRGGGMGFPAGPRQQDFVQAWQFAARLHKMKLV